MALDLTGGTDEPPDQGPPPGAWEPARQAARALVRPLEAFMKIQAASGVVLLAMALIIAGTWLVLHLVPARRSV